MRTSGGRGTEGWMAAIPIVALIAFATMSTEGVHSMLIMLDDTIRAIITSVVDLVRALF